MVEANKFKLGLFVLSAIILALVILFILGFSEYFKEKIHFMTVFDESVQGLDVGAPVKYRGVSIGKVTNVAIRPSKTGTDNLITVNMVALPSAVDPSALTYSGSPDSIAAKEEFFSEFFTQEVKKGLRCRIDMAGITGVKYIEIDYFEKAGKPKIDFKPPPGKFYLPSTPSLFKELSKNISQALYKISSIDFKRISNEMETTLISVNRYLNDPKISKLLDRLDKISNNLEETSNNINDSLTKENLTDIFNQLKSSLESVDSLAADLKKEVKSAKIEKTAQDMRITLKAAIQMRSEISETLNAITEFINYLDEDPSALLHGKQQPEFDFKKEE